MPESDPVPEAILKNPYITAKLLSPARGDVLVPKPHPLASHIDLPVPPESLWEGYGQTGDIYLESGRKDTEEMLAILRAGGARPGEFDRILDFGCAAGRMLRWFSNLDISERWGCDIKGETIAWCQQHLSPPMSFVTTTTLPHLPFEDHYFDLVYCGSVFTHIIDLPDAWFLELRRVIRPGGYGFVTIFDKHGLELVIGPNSSTPEWFVQLLRDFDSRTGAFATDFAYFSTDHGPGWGGLPAPQVCYDIDYLATKWSRLVEIVSVTQDFTGFQTGLLFKKRG
jgi:SAM-dependent methyltransferase